MLECAAKTLRADREIVLAAVQTISHNLRCAKKHWDICPIILREREIVLFASDFPGYALSFAAKDLQADREIVLAAVREHGSALAYAAKALRTDPEILAEANKSKECRPTLAKISDDEYSSASTLMCYR